MNSQISNNPAPYCQSIYSPSAIPCSQPGSSNAAGNFINDFINGFYTTGAIIDINNSNSGCSGLANNYIYYDCSYPLKVYAAQTLTCNFQSGNVYGEGFAVFIDWNQNNIFDIPTERVCGTPGVPSAGTWYAMTYTIPSSQPNGIYRMRVRSAYATAGNTIDPCLNYGYGEVEDYNVYIGVTPPTTPISYTVSANPNTICSGGSSILSATGATSYTWQPGGFLGPNILVSPSSTTAYTVTTNDTSTCAVSKTLSVTVNTCTFLEQKQFFENSLQIMPNPFNEELIVKVNGIAEIKFFNSLGQILFEKTIDTEEKIHTESLPKAMYYVSINNKDASHVFKIIKN